MSTRSSLSTAVLLSLLFQIVPAFGNIPHASASGYATYVAGVDSSTWNTWWQPQKPKPQCSDGIDNDWDGKIDYPYDTGCDSSTDNDEKNSVSQQYQETPVLKITKTGPEWIYKGQDAVYTVELKNPSNQTAYDVAVMDAPYWGLVYKSYGSTSGCIDNGVGVICSGITVPAKSSKTFTFVFTTENDNVICDMTMVNAGKYAATVFGQLSWRDSAYWNTKVKCANNELSIKKHGPEWINKGDMAIYTVDIKNAANYDATGITVMDQPYWGFVYNAAQSSSDCHATGNGNVATCENVTIPAKSTKTFTFAFETGDQSVPCNTSLVNTAKYAITVFGQPSWKANDSIHTQIKCEPKGTPKLTLDKKALQKKVIPGQKISYSLTVKNIGDGTAEDIVVIDPLDQQGFEFLPGESSSECFYSAGEGVVCGFVDLKKSTFKTFTIAWKAPEYLDCHGVVQNDAVAHSSNADSAYDWVKLAVDCDFGKLRLTKEGPYTIEPGQAITYTLTVQNMASNAWGNAMNTIVVDDFQKQGFVFLRDQSTYECQMKEAQGGVVCGPLSIWPGKSVTYKITWLVPDDVPCGKVKNHAVVSSPNATGDEAWFESTVKCKENPKLTLEKKAPKKIIPGETAKYTLTVKNVDKGSAEDVVVIDPLDQQGFTFVPGESSSECFYSAGEGVVCGFATLSKYQSATYTIAWKAPTTLECNGSVENQAVAHASNADSVYASAWSTVECQEGKLKLTKKGPEWFSPGAVVTYTLTVKNTGNGTATDTVVIDDLNTQGFVYLPDQSSNDACFFDGSEGVICGFLDLTPGQQKTFTIAWQAPQELACWSNVTNTAVAHSSTADSVEASFTGEVVCEQEAGPTQLDLQKYGPSKIVPGNVAKYTLKVKNTGDEEATDIVVTESVLLDLGFTFVPEKSSDFCTLAFDQVVCSIDSLKKYRRATVKVAFQAPEELTCNDIITNTAFALASNAETVEAEATSTVKCKKY